MGRKRKKSSKKEKYIKQTCAIIFVIIAALIGWKTPAIEMMNQVIENVGLSEYVTVSEEAAITPVAAVKENVEIKESVSENINIENEKLNIIFFDVGQADSVLIISNGQTMLIDSGNSKDGEALINGIVALNISKIDYLIGTHIHEDHIGSMSKIVDSFEIGKIYLPYNTTSTSSYYEKLLTSISKKELSIEEAVVDDEFKVGNANCKIMSVDNKEPENQNLASIVIQMEYGDLKYLFMGDSEEENEEARTWEDIDVLKVGHHGSNTSSSEEFLNQVLPEISVISVGEGNSYKLPKENILKRLENINSKIYRTDLDGTILLTSDGIENSITKKDISFDGN